MLSNLPTHRDGPGFRPIFRPTFYYPLNEPKSFIDGSIKLVFEIGTGAKEDFYKYVVMPIKESFDCVWIEYFLTEADKENEKMRREWLLQNAFNKRRISVDSIYNAADIYGIDNRIWYAISYRNDESDGWSKENDSIFLEAQKLGIEVGWFQVQGSRFVWAHCTEDLVKKLIKVLGEDRYTYKKEDKATIALVKKNRRRYPVPNYLQD